MKQRGEKKVKAGSGNWRAMAVRCARHLLPESGSVRTLADCYIFIFF